MTIKFIHLRRRDPFFGHLEPKGGVTVAYDVDPNGTIRYAWTKCRDNEHYCKKDGRDEASKRLVRGVWTDKKKKRYDVKTFPKVEGINLVEQILNHHDAEVG